MKQRVVCFPDKDAQGMANILNNYVDDGFRIIQILIVPGALVYQNWMVVFEYSDSNES